MTDAIPRIRYAARSRAWAAELDRPRTWLTAGERDELDRLRDAERRDQWLRGRWLGKQLLRQISGAAPDEIEILSRDARGLGTRPRVRIASLDAAWSLSISHTARGVLVGAAPADVWSVGVDLAGEVPDGVGFRQMWFNEAEQAWLAEGPPRRAMVLWGLKEALFKARQTGEPWSPQRVEVLPTADNRLRGSFYGTPLPETPVSLRACDGQIAVVVCLPRAFAPVAPQGSAQKPFFHEPVAQARENLQTISPRLRFGLVEDQLYDSASCL